MPHCQSLGFLSIYMAPLKQNTHETPSFATKDTILLYFQSFLVQNSFKSVQMVDTTHYDSLKFVSAHLSTTQPF